MVIQLKINAFNSFNKTYSAKNNLCNLKHKFWMQEISTDVKVGLIKNFSNANAKNKPIWLKVVTLRVYQYDYDTP